MIHQDRLLSPQGEPVCIRAERWDTRADLKRRVARLKREGWVSLEPLARRIQRAMPWQGLAGPFIHLSGEGTNLIVGVYGLDLSPERKEKVIKQAKKWLAKVDRPDIHVEIES